MTSILLLLLALPILTSAQSCQYGGAYIDECGNDCTCAGSFYGCTQKACLTPGQRPEVPLKCNGAKDLPRRNVLRVSCHQGIVITQKLDEKCIPGSVFKNDCNTCRCTSTGVVACSRKACVGSPLQVAGNSGEIRTCDGQAACPADCGRTLNPTGNCYECKCGIGEEEDTIVPIDQPCPRGTTLRQVGWATRACKPVQTEAAGQSTGDLVKVCDLLSPGQGPRCPADCGVARQDQNCVYCDCTGNPFTPPTPIPPYTPTPTPSTQPQQGEQRFCPASGVRAQCPQDGCSPVRRDGNCIICRCGGNPFLPSIAGPYVPPTPTPTPTPPTNGEIRVCRQMFSNIRPVCPADCGQVSEDTECVTCRCGSAPFNQGGSGSGNPTPAPAGCNYGNTYLDECNNECTCMNSGRYACTRRACRPGQVPARPMKCTVGVALPERRGRRQLICLNNIVTFQEADARPLMKVCNTYVPGQRPRCPADCGVARQDRSCVYCDCTGNPFTQPTPIPPYTPTPTPSTQLQQGEQRICPSSGVRAQCPQDGCSPVRRDGNCIICRCGGNLFLPSIAGPYVPPTPTPTPNPTPPANGEIRVCRQMFSNTRPVCPADCGQVSKDSECVTCRCGSVPFNQGGSGIVFPTPAPPTPDARQLMKVCNTYVPGQRPRCPADCGVARQDRSCVYCDCTGNPFTPPTPTPRYTPTPTPSTQLQQGEQRVCPSSGVRAQCPQDGCSPVRRDGNCIICSCGGNPFLPSIAGPYAPPTPTPTPTPTPPANGEIRVCRQMFSNTRPVCPADCGQVSEDSECVTCRCGSVPFNQGGSGYISPTPKPPTASTTNQRCRYGRGYIDECNNNCICRNGNYRCSRRGCPSSQLTPTKPRTCRFGESLPSRRRSTVRCVDGIVTLGN